MISMTIYDMISTIMRAQQTLQKEQSIECVHTECNQALSADSKNKIFGTFDLGWGGALFQK